MINKEKPKERTAWNKGIKMSKEFCKKVSESHKGQIPWNKGKTGINTKKQSKDKSERMKILWKNKEYRKKVSNAHKGQIGWSKGLTKETDERIKKHSERMKKNNPMFKKETQEKVRKANKGKNNWNWIDGRSYKKCPARYGDDWEAVRYLVYLRDHFTCQECGKTMKENGRALDVHHKIPFLVSFDNSLNNLITLCRSCHIKIERRLKNVIRK